jgi:hypothetical protein
MKKTMELLRSGYHPLAIAGLLLLTAGWNSEENKLQQNVLASANATYVVDGYAEHFSVIQGARVKFFLNCKNECDMHLELADVNENIVDSIRFYGFRQDSVPADAYVSGFGYKKSFTYRIPRHLSSGLYHWKGTDVMFLVKQKKQSAPVVIVYSSNTEQAYNNAGGKSLYDFNSTGGRAHSVSFQRPMNYHTKPGTDMRDFVLGFLQWLPGTNYNYQLISDTDMEDAASLSSAKLVVVIGHSEYWSRTARMNLDAYNDRGGDVAIFSGNTMWWQVRYSEKYDNLICYKDSMKDPVCDMQQKTVNWTSSYLQYPVMNSIGADFLHGGYGSKPDQGWDGYKIINPKSPLLQGTGLMYGNIISVPTHEFDGTALLPQSTEGSRDPVPDLKATGAYRTEIIGYDLGHCQVAGCRSVSTFIAYQRSPQSGTIVNTASTDWCNARVFFGKDGVSVQQITRNIFDLLLGDQTIFTATTPPGTPAN